MPTQHQPDERQVGSSSVDLRSTDLGDQPVAYADEPPGTEGDGKTTLPTWGMSFTVNAPTAAERSGRLRWRRHGCRAGDRRPARPANSE
ncbi:MAG: hypothetical protein L0H41_03105 [Microlunatus sp.]|nr:hypothetical protein [Microlunatus sp.]MDN5770446.1 hypothetical protein [Microlunatus sp.]